MKQFLLLVMITIHLTDVYNQSIPGPEWTKDLIVYEIATKNFTSPDGPGTGTFNSTRAKIPYLADLGINSVWITGHSWGNDGHFYGIWTQYACCQPDSIEPTLGTPGDLKSLVSEFHKYDIKVFLDVITHGVMNDSPLIEEHPEWFRGGSWGMTDYDWFGGHKELEDWWVKLHLDYVLNYGIDGFRLDVRTYRPDLWNRIKRECAGNGRKIVVFDEWQNFNGSSDFLQRQTSLSNIRSGLDTANVLIYNVAKYFNSIGKPDKDDPFYLSVQLSCHDDGWESFPAGNNPYVAEGSRCLFGYSCLFTPAIPLFMSGEEFNAKFIPNPKLTPDLYGKGKPGEGTWLYGAVIGWKQINQKPHNEMLKDVKKMIAIRKAENDIFHAYRNDTIPEILELEYKSTHKIPVPYAIQNDEKIIIVAGNNTENDVECVVTIPAEHTGVEPNKTYTIEDLWNGKKWNITGNELEHFTFIIPGDKVLSGGISIFKIIK